MNPVVYVLDTKTLVPVLFTVLVAEIALLTIFPAAQTFVRDLRKVDDIKGFDAAKALRLVSLANAASIAISITCILAILTRALLAPTGLDGFSNLVTLLKTIQFSTFSLLLCWFVLRANPN